jgi:hypothetical protein
MLAAGVALAAGCATDPAIEDPATTGQLVVPLTQAGGPGELYHLTNATFDVFDATSFVGSLDGSTTASQVSLDLSPGLFSVSLRDGWLLERSIDGGQTYAPVSALLGSVNPAAFRVLANQPVFINFDFLVRNVAGTLDVRLGVIAHPRELAGGMVIDHATGGFATYADPANNHLDFAIYYEVATLTAETLPDGTRQHVYTAGPIGTAGPIPPQATPVAAEFYNDTVGVLAGTIQPDLAAGFLQYFVAARPDATVELSGQLFGGTTELDFAPSPIDAPPALGGDGFPADEFFYDAGVPFTLTHSLGTISGTLRTRHIVQ